MQDARGDLLFPDAVEADLAVQPVFQPARLGQARLHRIVGEQVLVDVQVGRVQRLLGAAGRGHQHADLGERQARLHAGVLAAVVQRAAHVLQVGAGMAGLVLRHGLVDGLDDRLGVPFGGAAVPVVQAHLAAEVQHQRFQLGRDVEFEAHVVQLFLGGHQVGTEAAQVLDQHQGMLLFFEEPHRHERAEIAVAAIVAQEHLGGRQCGPFGDGVHLDRVRLLVRELAAIEVAPGNIVRHVPAHRFHGLEEFRIKHVLPLFSSRCGAIEINEWRTRLPA
ncbi:Uncharacterised protein [Achromobacter sp. 2789STDY5608628]|nr:Uncharacterised protein [Achromobacter sp. 2789STDY5608628]